MTHYWKKEPVLDIAPALAKRHTSYAMQYVLCLSSTGKPVGMVRKLPRARWPKDFWGPVRTAWFTGGEIQTKRHHYVDTAKKFLERKFIRTNGKDPVLKTGKDAVPCVPN